VRPRPPAKAVIRLEKKGRAGKEVTVIDQLDLSQGELSEWLRDLKQRLGCGGAIEERALVLQGNQCQRVRAYLETRAVGQIRGPK
jgi:translation initiation factor 1